jgi:hypothetical protein
MKEVKGRCPPANPGGRGQFRNFKGHVNPKPHGFGHHGGMHQGVLRTSGHRDGHQVGKRSK